jgi:hypothetical protein
MHGNMMINRNKNITENTNPNTRDNRSWLPPKSTSKNINGIKQVKSIANLNPNPIRPTSR